MSENQRAEYTEDALKFAHLVKNQAAWRNVDPMEYAKAMNATLEDGFAKYPGDFQAASEYAAALLNEKYPIPQEDTAHE